MNSSDYSDYSDYSEMGNKYVENQSFHRWESIAKICKRDLLIKKIAIAAIVALGLILAGTGVGLLAGGTLLTVGALLAAGGGLMAISSLAYSRLGMDWKDYSDPKVAKEVIGKFNDYYDENKNDYYDENMNDFLKKDPKAKAETIGNIRKCGRIGYISQENSENICKCLEKIDELDGRYNAKNEEYLLVSKQKKNLMQSKKFDEDKAKELESKITRLEDELSEIDREWGSEWSMWREALYNAKEEINELEEGILQQQRELLDFFYFFYRVVKENFDPFLKGDPKVKAEVIENIRKYGRSGFISQENSENICKCLEKIDELYGKWIAKRTEFQLVEKQLLDLPLDGSNLDTKKELNDKKEHLLKEVLNLQQELKSLFEKLINEFDNLFKNDLEPLREEIRQRENSDSEFLFIPEPEPEHRTNSNYGDNTDFEKISEVRSYFTISLSIGSYVENNDEDKRETIEELEQYMREGFINEKEYEKICGFLKKADRLHKEISSETENEDDDDYYLNLSDEDQQPGQSYSEEQKLLKLKGEFEKLECEFNELLKEILRRLYGRQENWNGTDNSYSDSDNWNWQEVESSQ